MLILMLLMRWPSFLLMRWPSFASLAKMLERGDGERNNSLLGQQTAGVNFAGFPWRQTQPRPQPVYQATPNALSLDRRQLTVATAAIGAKLPKPWWLTSRALKLNVAAGMPAAVVGAGNMGQPGGDW